MQFRIIYTKFAVYMSLYTAGDLTFSTVAHRLWKDLHRLCYFYGMLKNIPFRTLYDVYLNVRDDNDDDHHWP